MAVKNGIHPAYRESKSEAIPDAKDRASFYGGAAEESMTSPRRSLASVDKEIRADNDFKGKADAPGWAKLETAAQTRNDYDRSAMRKTADLANTAARYGDVATGRKKPSKDLD